MKNIVQFQEGMSLPEFMGKYGTEEKCIETLFELRWAKGYSCPECGNSGYSFINTRKLWQCLSCKHQTSITSDTIFHATKLPLTTWFLAIYLITQDKNGISSLELKRKIGVNYNTAWALKHKVMQVMVDRQKDHKLSGRIEIDDAYIGGEKEGKRGRGSENKSPFVAAVETTADGKPVQAHFRSVVAFSSEDLEKWAKKNIAEGSVVVSDGLACFRAVTAANCEHQIHVCGSGKNSVKNRAFLWVNTLLGNLKTALNGTYHSIGRQYIARYLAEFEYRINRRYDLKAILRRFVKIAVKSNPYPIKKLRLAEIGG
jgi:ribosomal protein L37AE/L43A